MVCGPDVNLHTSSSLASHQYLGVAPGVAFDLARFRAGLRVDVASMTRTDMTFHLRGASPAIANALRRVMIAETPTMAIENVFIVNNTSVLPDDVLSHRLGMVPLAADCRRFDWRGAEEAPSERNTIVFRLRAKCYRRPDGSVVNDRVYSRQLTWLPRGSEMPDETGCRFVIPQEGVGELPGEEAMDGAADELAAGGASSSSSFLRRGLGPVHGDILLARLRPGQEIDVEVHAVKGVGEDHAKFSPVSTAWYRLMPEVALLRDVVGDEARQLAQQLPGLVTLEEAQDDDDDEDMAEEEEEKKKKKKKKGKASSKSSSTSSPPAVRAAIAEDVLAYDSLLERVRRLSGTPEFRDALQLRKVKDHFIFTIESTGAWKPQDIFKYAVKVLQSKCDKVLEGLATFPQRSY